MIYRLFITTSEVKKKFFPWLIGLLLFGVIVIASFSPPELTQLSPAENMIKLTFDAPITLHFSEIMNQGSVERAFQLSPKIEGRFNWKDFRTLEFYPSKPLKIGDEYELTLKSEARSIWLKRIGFDTTLDYVVTGPPYILFADPADQSVITNGAITVMFDRPMALKDLKQDDLIQSDPKMNGKIRLMGMSAFQLLPERLSAGKKYKLTVPAGLAAQDGGKTKEAFSWTVSPPSLKVLKTDPAENDAGVNTTQPLTVYFNEEVDLNGIKPGTNALLYPSNDLDAGRRQKMDGFFNTEVTYLTDPNGAVRKDAFVFTPSFPYQPATDYRFALKSDTDLHLQKDFDLHFRTEGGKETSVPKQEPPKIPGAASSPTPQEPDSLFEAGGKMQFYTAGAKPKLKLKQPLSEPAELSVCPIPSNQYIKLSAVGTLSTYKCEDTQPTTLDYAARNIGQTLDLSKYVSLEWVPGVYFVSLKEGEKKSVQLFAIEDVSLLLKRSASDLVVWALDAKSGQTLPNFGLEILSYDGETLAHGNTDESGVFRAEQPFDEGIYVRAKTDPDAGGHFGLVSDRWFLSGQTPNADNRLNPGLYVYLNQEVFFPGDTVQIEGIWRTVRNHILNLPETSRVSVGIEGDQQNLVPPATISLRNNGSFGASFKLPKGAVPGPYQITVTDVNGQSLTDPLPIQIQNSASDVKLEWLEAEDSYPSGSAPVIAVKARYSSGIPAGNFDGSYQLFRQPTSVSYEEGAVRYVFGGQDSCTWDCPGKERVAQKDFVFDKNGEAKLTMMDAQEGFLASGYVYELTVSFSAPGSPPVSLSRSFKVHQGLYDLGLGLKHQLIRSNDPLEVSFICLSYAGKPVAGKTVRLSLIGDEGRGKSVYENTLTSTAASYQVSVPLGSELKDGIYLLHAESQDDKNNKIVAEQRVYLNRDKRFPIVNRLFLGADQTKYFVGGRAHLFVNDPDASSKKPVPIFLTFERDGLLDYESMVLTSPVTEINVPITNVMFPRFLVSATRYELSLPPAFNSASQMIEVGDDESKISVDLTTDPSQPSPGSEMTLNFFTHDYQNQPLPAVLAVNVEEGEVQTPDLSYDLFLPSGGAPMFSASSLSLGGTSDFGSKTENPAPVFYPEFFSSVYFNPLVVTDNNGKGSVKIILPKESENLTVSVLATSGSQLFGSRNSVLKMSHELLIQPILPGFVIPGDHTVFGASVKNVSDHPVHTLLNLVSSDLPQNDTSRNVSLDPGQETEVSFSVLVDPLLDKDQIQLRFQAGQDSTEQTIPIQHLKSSLTVSNGAPLTDSWDGNILFPADVHPGIGTLELTFAGNPDADAKVRANALSQCSLDNTYLTAAKLLSALSFLPASSSDSLLAPSANFLKELEASADENGAFRYWNETNPSPTLSALALFAYSQASAKGLLIDSAVINRTAAYLLKALDSESLSPEDRLLILWSLSKNGQYDTERTLTVFQQNPDLSARGKAFLLLNLDQLVQAGQGSLSSLIDSVKSKLADEMPHDRKTAAILLYALSDIDPSNPMLGALADRVFSEKGDLLLDQDPEESLWIILGLNSYSKTVSAPARYILTAKVDGKVVLDQSVTSPLDVFRSSFNVQTFENSKLDDLAVEKKGTGQLYFDAHLTTFKDPTLVSRTEDGLLLLRQFYELKADGEKVPATHFSKGGYYLSELEMIVPKTYQAITLTNPIPAGFRPSVPVNGNGLPFGLSASSPSQMTYFAPELKPGIYKVSTELQAVLPGNYILLPAVLHPLFESAVSRTEGGILEITD